jgi:hypothetical protein
VRGWRGQKHTRGVYGQEAKKGLVAEINALQWKNNGRYFGRRTQERGEGEKKKRSSEGEKKKKKSSCCTLGLSRRAILHTVDLGLIEN